MSGKVVPLGGVHRSAKSLLAEIMSDETVSHLAIVVIHEDGSAGVAHYEMTVEELCFAAEVLRRRAFGDNG